MKNLLLKIRKFWRINPRTKIKKSNKLYNRAKEKTEIKKEIKNDNG